MVKQFLVKFLHVFTFISGGEKSPATKGGKLMIKPEVRVAT